MTIGTIFTLLVVPVVYGLIAAEHRSRVVEAGEALVLQPAMATEAARA